MCTLTLAWQVFDDAPVAVAANRDESLERESLPPGVYRDSPRVIAPRDAEAGGTWIGANEHGLFVGVTNRWGTPELAAERSRGLLVADALEAESAAEATALVEEETAAREYDGFYLVLADERDALCLQWNGALERTDFEPGVHVVVNAAVDDDVRLPSERTEAAREQARNARRVRRELTVGREEQVDDWLERAGGVLGDHDYGVCVHGDGYGTRSSSLIALGANSRYLFAPGPPCETTYEPVAAAASDGNREGHI
ncbi:NRDE family protein [Natronococcus sp. A-GB1]|uniref:NRDE family protein n=1 Tax=Natronococcus sp. A-GB1 TaxID=3037648 RepID=UPI00241E2C85|nr:NRDE family protein [Natronococcus sp. A-GB1]MDG5759417.1 NRDE family protein [Natronococcus sp. A-GB1]